MPFIKLLCSQSWIVICLPQHCALLWNTLIHVEQSVVPTLSSLCFTILKELLGKQNKSGWIKDIAKDYTAYSSLQCSESSLLNVQSYKLHMSIGVCLTLNRLSCVNVAILTAYFIQLLLCCLGCVKNQPVIHLLTAIISSHCNDETLLACANWWVVYVIYNLSVLEIMIEHLKFSNQNWCFLNILYTGQSFCPSEIDSLLGRKFAQASDKI